MNKKPWFRSRTYGWGWTPCSWEGWTVVAVFILFLVRDFLRIDENTNSTSDTLRPFIGHMVIATLILVAISYWKGDRAKWSQEEGK